MTTNSLCWCDCPVLPPAAGPCRCDCHKPPAEDTEARLAAELRQARVAALEWEGTAGAMREQRDRYKAERDSAHAEPDRLSRILSDLSRELREGAAERDTLAGKLARAERQDAAARCHVKLTAAGVPDGNDADGWPGLDERVMGVVEERDKLAAFKAYVHHRLDAAGVPHRPPGPHGAEGCRVGDRLDWLMAGRDALREALTWAAGFIRCHHPNVWDEYPDYRNAAGLVAGEKGLLSGEFTRTLARAELAEGERDRLRAALELIAAVRHVSGSAHGAFRANLRTADAALAGADCRKLEVVEAVAAGTWTPEPKEGAR